MRSLTIRKFKSFAEAEAADHEYYRNLSPHQRMEIFFELLKYGPEPDERIPAGHARIHRVTKRTRR